MVLIHPSWRFRFSLPEWYCIKRRENMGHKLRVISPIHYAARRNKHWILPALKSLHVLYVRCIYFYGISSCGKHMAWMLQRLFWDHTVFSSFIINNRIRILHQIWAIKYIICNAKCVWWMYKDIVFSYSRLNPKILKKIYALHRS